ncbi:MAG: putative metal-dependent hydrolase [Rhodobacteraceae bacterium HLUCCA12]|nr:MAG: putative metal-dependent hydrolase [Rhodobacteraceae bacterium HLUCCA12]
MSNDSETTHLPGDPPIIVHWRRSARARRISLRVSGLDGKITLTLPSRTDRRHGHEFLNERVAWLRAALSGLPGRCPVGPGAVIPMEGAMLTVTPSPVRAARADGDRLLVPERGDVGPRVTAYLKLRARQKLNARVHHHATALGRIPGRITLRDPRSRWGSCSAAGDLMFSWRLILAPPEVLDYVAAHEVAHLAQMNHSPAFWAEVERLMPGYAEPRLWLRIHGAGLHRYRFGPA